MKKIVMMILTGVLLFCFCSVVHAESPAITRKQYRRNLASHKNAFPAGWQYQAGYTVWRMQRKLPVNRNTYRMYKRDRIWHNRMSRYHRPEDIALDTIDWTVEELTLLMREYGDYLKFHPAGFED